MGGGYILPSKFYHDLKCSHHKIAILTTDRKRTSDCRKGARIVDNYRAAVVKRDRGLLLLSEVGGRVTVGRVRLGARPRACGVLTLGGKRTHE